MKTSLEPRVREVDASRHATRADRAAAASPPAEDPQAALSPPGVPPPPEILMRWVHDQDGVSLATLSERGPVLVVFLRHFGCTFCREALSDLSKKRERIERNGTRIALVHMGEEERAAEFVRRFGLDDVSRFADPARRLYRSFGLHRGSAGALLGWKTWRRGVVAGILRGHGIGKLDGDGFQMPGVFLVRGGRIVRAFRHRSAADRPDYDGLAACPADGGACGS